MFKCKQCGYKFEYTGCACQVCGSMPIIDSEDAELARSELDIALREKNMQKIHACRRLLADMGDTESRREYAKLIERGDYQIRDIDTAMNYYFLAAEDNDSYSAYRYSRLVRRHSQRAADFWLKFAGVLGSIDSYPENAELFSIEGKEDAASYYYALAAACDDTDSIVTMAKRWYEGIGLQKNEAFAKWYLDKMVIPPISAVKLAYKLRSVRASEPPKISFPDYTAYIRSLKAEAKELSFETAEFYLTSLLCHAGDKNAEAALGMMLAEGRGCKRDLTRAEKCINASIASGNPAAAVYMGDILIEGEFAEKDPKGAMEYYSTAAKLGSSDAYEKLGDIYHEGKYAKKSIPKALEFYELASLGGSSSAKSKCEKIKAVRERYYLDAYKTMVIKAATGAEEASEAFKNAAIASLMGETRAMILLAKCYLHGFGTKLDRQSAYVWFKSSAEAGNADGIFYLGLCHSRGIGTNFSYKAATDALKFAQSAGIKGAAEELDRLYRRRMNKMVRSLYSMSMRLIYQGKYGEAVKLLLSFDSLSYPKALYTLGCMYEFGRGVPRSDRKRANYYYEKAYEGSYAFGNFKDPSSEYKLKILKMIR